MAGKTATVRGTHRRRGANSPGRAPTRNEPIDGPNHLRAATPAKDEANEAILGRNGLAVVRFSEAAIDREPRAVLHALATGIASRHGS
jgi:hypothetical protein